MPNIFVNYIVDVCLLDLLYIFELYVFYEVFYTVLSTDALYYCGSFSIIWIYTFHFIADNDDDNIIKLKCIYYTCIKMEMINTTDFVVAQIKLTLK